MSTLTILIENGYLMSSENIKSRKTSKILISILGAVVCMVFLTNLFSHKNNIFKIVRGNIELLNNSVQATRYDDAYKIKVVKDIHEYTNLDVTKVIDYYIYGGEYVI